MSDSLQPNGLESPWNFAGQNIGMGSLSLLQGNLPNPGIKPRSPTLQADSLPDEPQRQIFNVCIYNIVFYAKKSSIKMMSNYTFFYLFFTQCFMTHQFFVCGSN